MRYLFEESLIWFKRKIVQLYPTLPEKALPDFTTILVSIFKGYVGILIRSKHAYNVNLVPTFLLNRIDSIIEGLLKTDDPLLNPLPWLECSAQAIEPKEEIKLLIDRLLRMKATGQVISKESEAIEAIREEFAKDRPSGIIIESLLLYLEKTRNEVPFALSLL